MELHPSFWYSSGSFLHSSGRFPRSSGSPSDAPPELSASKVLQTSLGPYWTLSEIKGTVLRWGAQHTSWGQSPSESVILTPPRDCMHPRATVFNSHRQHFGSKTCSQEKEWHHGLWQGRYGMGQLYHETVSAMSLVVTIHWPRPEWLGRVISGVQWAICRSIRHIM